MLRMTMPDPMWAAAAAAAWWNEQGVDCRKTNLLSHSKSTRCDSVLAVGNGSGGSSGGGGCFGFTSHLVIFFSFFSFFLTVSLVYLFISKGQQLLQQQQLHSRSNCKFISFPLCVPASASACLPSLQNILLNLQIVIIIPLDVLFSLFYPPIQHWKKERKKSSYTSALDRSLHNTFACPVSAHRTKLSAQYLEMCVCQQQQRQRCRQELTVRVKSVPTTVSHSKKSIFRETIIWRRKLKTLTTREKEKERKAHTSRGRKAILLLLPLLMMMMMMMKGLEWKRRSREMTGKRGRRKEALATKSSIFFLIAPLLTQSTVDCSGAQCTHTPEHSLILLPCVVLSFAPVATAAAAVGAQTEIISAEQQWNLHYWLVG